MSIHNLDYAVYLSINNAIQIITKQKMNLNYKTLYPDNVNYKVYCEKSFYAWTPQQIAMVTHAS